MVGSYVRRSYHRSGPVTTLYARLLALLSRTSHLKPIGAVTEQPGTTNLCTEEHTKSSSWVAISPTDTNSESLFRPPRMALRLASAKRPLTYLNFFAFLDLSLAFLSTFFPAYIDDIGIEEKFGSSSISNASN